MQERARADGLALPELQVALMCDVRPAASLNQGDIGAELVMRTAITNPVAQLGQSFSTARRCRR